MTRFAVVARLKEGARSEVEALLRAGPPFDPEAIGFARHAVYLSATEIVFVFEGPQAERIVTSMVNDPVLSAAFGPWANLVDGPPHIAHEAYFWEQGAAAAGAAGPASA